MHGFGDLVHFRESLQHNHFDMPLASPADLSGGSAAENVSLLNDMMDGQGPKGLANSIILNAGTAFFIVNKTASIQEGCSLAADILYNGRLREWIESVKTFYSDLS